MYDAFGEWRTSKFPAWRVLEQRHSTDIATKDSNYDKITEFTDEGKAHFYYTSVFNSNYVTKLEELIDGKWTYKAASCCSECA